MKRTTLSIAVPFLFLFCAACVPTSEAQPQPPQMMQPNGTAQLASAPVLTEEIATQLALEAQKAAKQASKTVTVTVVDRSGQVLAQIRNHAAGVHTLSASYDKAFTAASTKRETAAIAEAIKQMKAPADLRFIKNFSTLPGGIPIEATVGPSNQKIVIGGIGVGGASGTEDAGFAKAALTALSSSLRTM